MGRMRSARETKLDQPSHLEARLRALDLAREALAREIEAVGVCAAELTVLRGFGTASTRRWEDLRVATALEPAGLSDALDSLVARSLVTVRPCTESAEFVLTPRGSTTLRRAHRRLEEIARRRSDA